MTIALIPVALAAIAGLAAPVPVYREIGDWILGCDNVRRCEVKYVPAKDGTGDGDAAGLRFARDGGQADMELTVGSGALDTRSVRIDGRASGTGLSWHRTPDETSADGPAVTALARQAVAGRTLTLAADGGTRNFSLRGLAATMLAMDEAQGRLGNRSAIVRTGSRPATATPPAPPLPIIVGRRTAPLADAAALAARVRRDRAAMLVAHECDMEAGVGDEATALTARQAIVLLGCGRFAYQTSVLAFRVDRRPPYRAVPLLLPSPPTLPRSTDTRDAGEYVGGTFDAGTMTFADFAKGRGLADCGIATRWTFDGTAFRLIEFIRQERCGGEAGDWLTLYRARTVAR